MDSHRPPTAVHWRALDSVRGAAVVAVVLWHVYKLTVARGMDPHAVPWVFWPLGTLRLGVDIFFVLSGLLVVQSWQSTRARAANGVHASWSFLTRRARRILPAYWVSLIVLIPLVGAPLLQHPRRLLAFATLNQYVKFWLPEKVNPVTWSLTTEWHFYLLVPIVAWLLVRVGRWPVWGGCVALSFVWFLHPPLLLPSSFVFGRLDQFVLGAIVGQIARENPDHVLARCVRRPAVLAAAVAVGLVVGSYHGATLGLANHLVIDAVVHPLFGVCTAIVLLNLLTSGTPVPGHTTLAWFGTISFGLYLWHYPILDQGLQVARSIEGMPSALATLLAVPLLCACAVLVAKCSYVFVERPFIARVKRQEAPKPAGTLAPWPSPRSSASRPSTA
jgi:peptidoglycan/LPS O-acetylase OafA/YrhL